MDGYQIEEMVSSLTLRIKTFGGPKAS